MPVLRAAKNAANTGASCLARVENGKRRVKSLPDSLQSVHELDTAGKKMGSH